MGASGGGRGRGLIIGLMVGARGFIGGRRLPRSLDFSQSVAQTGVTSVRSLGSVRAVRISRLSARSCRPAVNDDAGEARKMERRVKETIVSAGTAAIELVREEGKRDKPFICRQVSETFGSSWWDVIVLLVFYFVMSLS